MGAARRIVVPHGAGLGAAGTVNSAAKWQLLKWNAGDGDWRAIGAPKAGREAAQAVADGAVGKFEVCHIEDGEAWKHERGHWFQATHPVEAVAYIRRFPRNREREAHHE